MNPGASTVQSDRVVETRISLAAAIIVGILIFGVGLVFIMGQSNDWTANSTGVVLPKQDVPRDSAPSYYDTLSQGQIVETYAEILRGQQFKADSVKALNLGAAGDAATVTVAVVPNTALLTVTASGPTAETAEKLADSVLDLASRYISTKLPAPYQIAAVSTADGTATQPPSNSTTLLIALFVVSIVIAFATYQGVSQLLLLRSRRRSNESDDDADDDAAGRPSAGTAPAQEPITVRGAMDWPRKREPEVPLPAPVPASSWPRRPGESSSADS